MTKSEIKKQIKNLFDETKGDLELSYDKAEITEEDLDTLRDKVLTILNTLDTNGH